MDEGERLMHTIRLRRPWCKSIETGSVPLRVDVPELNVETTTSEEQQTSTYRRSFNTPSGLSDSSRVYLRVDGWEGCLEFATLNGSPLVVGKSKINAEITDLLKPNNQITISLADRGGQPARLSGEVTLAIDDNG
jgi:hypothetical protein